ncbi:hypothetical protein O6H91_18G069500 [Diphasiastrum complanatum]|uniref:Uncharacterized protein n=4 Tax=Diphasiastrum complanatum TaxID=34168 RepID=A0ACC2B2D0_DIPCM|nr:hypothetical protein O6H91_Y388500 [Diphasiastrum complanatum]KAJ7298834.1 hypothetical protein O6H91_Y388500 [Diphasiastrum complanatum]KAJ7298835.1 hypothetical protein O6H91_Y388500 [Diphasiastrum complanatum]KAJ7298837.1 hypothetical protein O6H91_Y388500 [Diphasiastrum complanatum]KAJ7298838.1 hypothetical protein O6H91_Y388500 [Diphasiastrum complanatum]
MEPATSFFSRHPLGSTTLSQNGSASGFNKEWQRNGEVNYDQWATDVDKKSHLSAYSLSTIEPRIPKSSSLSTHARITASSDNSLDYTENGFSSAFSNSFPDLFSSKLQILDSEESVGHSAASAVLDLSEEAEADEVFPFSKEFESHAIGNLLPDDEDELLAGVTDELDSMLPSHIIDDTEEFDLFSSGGGMELEGEVPVSLGPYYNSDRTIDIWAGYPSIQHSGPTSVAGEHPYGEHPSRTLFVRNINSNVEDSELRNLFEQYGDIRTLYTACKHRGFVMISYYDIRAARSAMRALQNKPLRRRKLDIHFSIPKDNPSDKDVNQGTLVVFNLDASVSNEELRQIFGVYGEVKEIRETPHKRHHKFIEFYDVRAAEAALWALNRSDIAGKRIKLEPSRPGGARRSLMQQLSQELEQEEIRPQRQQAHSPLSHSPSGHPSHWAAVHNIADAVPSMSLQHIPASANLNTSSSSPSNGVVAANLPPRISSTKVGNIATHFGQFGQIEGSPLGSPKVQHQMPPYHPDSLPEFGSLAVNFSQTGHSPGSSSSLRARDGAEGSRLQRSANSANVDILGFDHGMGVGGVSGGSSISNDNGIPLSSKQFLWGNLNPYLHHPQNSPPIMWSTTSATNTYNHIGRVQPQPQPNPFPGTHGRLGDALVSAHHHHVGSAPSGEVASLDIHHGYFADSPNTSSLLRSGSLGGMGLGPHATHALNIHASHGMINFGPTMANGGGVDCGPATLGFMPPQQRARFFSNGGPPVAFMNSMDGFLDRGRNRRGDVSSTQADSKKQYQLDIDRILRGEDPRTTLMIKNIPNKYTAKMLLAAIDEHHRGSYDFIYLPIDFKNKCNVGYAFINMIDPFRIVPFYEAFHGKKWEKFNSEKVASLAYGRIQGKAALIAHFQNSSLMNEDKRCRPILFHTEGPNVGDQEPFPVGINVRTRSSRDRNSNGSTQPGSPSASSSSSSKDESVLESETSEFATSAQIPQDAERE